ncbi:HIT family protein [Nocardiopsis lambiniae]|uniref:HIT family protein n=1 Tax=Nocardiopsis lambiniae TaxID=3075539 RepID=A0ABU2M6T8_9ACTN|nr:HIT family protein [Nocardiopsis sp. DSM 44743]MDT0328366.1 HIT family protein [Nocardiopsis sp. DSM 44743]
MPTLFTRIIDRELPGRFVWEDPVAVAFLSIAPLRPGHTLVVPRAEVDDWTTADPELLDHCFRVAGAIGRGVRHAFDAPRAGLLIAGLEVPHLHIHVSPLWETEDLDVTSASVEEDQDALEDAAQRLRRALTGLGFAEAVAPN